MTDIPWFALFISQSLIYFITSNEVRSTAIERSFVMTAQPRLHLHLICLEPSSLPGQGDPGPLNLDRFTFPSPPYDLGAMLS